MKIAMASDHAGFKLKGELVEHLKASGNDVSDLGPPGGERSDYPDYAKKVAALVAKGSAERGVLVCGSGMGMCMTANRFRGVRAAVLRDASDAEMSRRHNDANVACFGARVTEFADAKKLIDIFLATKFEGGRHELRVKKMDDQGDNDDI